MNTDRPEPDRQPRPAERRAESPVESTGERRRVRKKRSSSVDFISLTEQHRWTWRELMEKDRWFVAVLAVLAVLAVSAFVLLPRIWRASPPGFRPILRVSGLDLLQMRLAVRSAEAATARGDWTGARDGWRRAMAANSGSADAKRRYLSLAVQRGVAETNPDEIRLQLRESEQLLQLEGTNVADLELVAAVTQVAELPGRALALLTTIPPARLTTNGLATLAMSHFEGDDFPSFQQVLAAAPGLADAHPGLRLERAAAAVITAETEVGLAPRWQELDRLAEADRGTPALLRLADRLRLVAAAYRGDEPRFQAAYISLEKRGELRPRDQVRRWQLLTRLGRKEEAIEKARQFALPATSPAEAIQVMRALDWLGLPLQGIDYGQRTLERYHSDPALWREVGRRLIRARQTEPLLVLANSLRRLEPEETPQPGFADFCTGVGEKLMQRNLRAEEAFVRALTDPLLTTEPLLALECADTLRRFSFPILSEQLVQRVLERHGSTDNLWARAYAAAGEARIDTWMLDAARREYRLTPDSEPARHRYLHALILNRTNAPEALTLAQALPRSGPDATVVLQSVWYAGALAMHQRWADAERVLAGLPTSQLGAAGPEVINQYFLIRGEGLIELERRSDAAKLLARVDASRLFPGELQRYQLLRERTGELIK